jgi:hypothetical protein
MVVSIQVTVALQEPVRSTQPVATTRPTRTWAILKSMSDHISLEIPPPLSERDIDRYAHMLRLSVEQVHYLRSHHADYLQRLVALEREHADQFSQAATNFNRAEYGSTYYGGFRNWRATEDRFYEALTREDQRLFIALEMVLSADQLEGMPRVRLHRDQWHAAAQRNAARHPLGDRAVDMR